MLSSIYWYLIWQLFASTGVVIIGPFILFNSLSKYSVLL